MLDELDRTLAYLRLQREALLPRRAWLFGAGATVKNYSTQDEANQDLASGRIDYSLRSAAVMSGLLQTDGGKACCEFKGSITDTKVLSEGIGAGLRKGDAELKAKIDAAIKAVAKSGEFDRITAKYPELKDAITTPKP